MVKQNAPAKKTRLFIFKEIALAVLAAISLGTVIVELLRGLNSQELRVLNRIDFTIACIFLLDFIIEMYQSKQRKVYLKKNWYLLLAAIPLTDTITDALRGLRLLRLLRLIRAGEHIDIGYRSTKQKT